VNPSIQYDVIIAGAGPGGCACAISLADAGLSVLILEKDTFPRDKICGDALSPDVLNQLAMLNGDMKDEFLDKFPHQKVDVVGVRIVAANGKMAELSIEHGESKLNGWVAKRIDFDRFMFTSARKQSHVTILEECKVADVQVSDTGVAVSTSKGDFTSQIAIGAAGAHSIISKKLTGHKMDRDHYCRAVRAYFTNVGGFHDDGMIELHFYNSLLPGSFWIFPPPDNQANVGLGMLSSYISKKNINLRQEMQDVIEREPALKERFKDAVMIDKVQGFGLPLGSKKRKLSGERFMLIGDAASLIDPITGEGIGNAIRSGRYAADQIKACFKQSDFSARQMKNYDEYLYSKVWGEMRFSRFLQTGFRYPFVINTLVSLADRSMRFRQFLNLVITDAGFWGDGLNPKRWLKHWKEAEK